MTDSTGDVPRERADVIAFNHSVITEFRAHDGKVGGAFANTPLLLLGQVGASSGQCRVTPLFYTQDGDDLVVVASNAGAPTHPHWYLNLVSHPEVTVELPGLTFRARARVAVGDERAHHLRVRAELLANTLEYQAMTTREIPVVVLHRLIEGASS